MKHARLLYGWIGLALVAGSVATPLLADEMYSWTDENGVRHFSSLPPPPGLEATVSDLPDSVPVPAVDVDYPDATDSTASVADDAFSAEQDTEELSAADQYRQQIADTRAEQRSAQAEMDQACIQARNRLAQIEPSRRVFYTDESGETVRMDDEERVGEVETLSDFISSHCD